MTDAEWAAIQRLANECLFECLNSETPLTKLHDFVATLEDNGWDKEAILDVEDIILDALEIMRHTEADVVVH